MATTTSERLRLDKWLWAARFYKTRSLSADEIERGRVRVNGAPCKPARELKLGDLIELRQGEVLRSVRVLGLSAQRGPAPQAALLYQETDASLAQRAALAEQRRLAPEPGRDHAQGRPTKRDRRQIQGLRDPADGPPPWNERWSAGI